MTWGQGHFVSMCEVPALGELTSQRIRTQKDPFVRKQRMKTKAKGIPTMTFILSRDAHSKLPSLSGVSSAWAINQGPTSSLSDRGMTECAVDSMLYIRKPNSVYCT